MSTFTRRQTLTIAALLLLLSAKASVAETSRIDNKEKQPMPKLAKTVVPGKNADGASNTESRDGRGTNGGNITTDDRTVVEGTVGDVEIKGNSAKGGSGNKVTF